MARLNPDSERLSMLLSCYLDGALTPEELDEEPAAQAPIAAEEAGAARQAFRALLDLEGEPNSPIMAG